MEAPVTWTPTPTCLSVSKSLLNGWRKVGEKIECSPLLFTLFPFKCWLYALESPALDHLGKPFPARRTVQDRCLPPEKKILKSREGLMSLCGGHGTAGGRVPVHHLVPRDTSLWLKVFRQIKKKNGFKTPSKLAILHVSHCSSLLLRADVRPPWHSVAGLRSSAL